MTNPDSSESLKQFGGVGVSADLGAQSSAAGAYEFPPLESMPESPSSSLSRPVPEPQSPQLPNYQSQQQQLYAQGDYYGSQHPQPRQQPYPQGRYCGYRSPAGYRPRVHPNRQDTHGLAAPALCCSLIGVAPAYLPLLGIPGFYSIISIISGTVGIIFGVVASSQIKKTGQEGRGMALSGVAVGLVSVLVSVGCVVLDTVGVLG